MTAILALNIKRGYFRSADGSKLAYQSVGDGPPVVLANGLGGTFFTWRHLYTHLAGRYRVVSWDYRGLHGSEAPKDREAITVPYHVDDMQALLAHLAIERAAFIGWSMGVQVNFELFRRAPEVFVGLGVINGTAGRTFESVRGGILSTRLLPAALLQLAARGDWVNAIAQRATRWTGFVGVLKRLGVIAPTLDEDIFHELAVEFGQLDFPLYLRTLYKLGEHDAWDVLPKVNVPTTVIAGGKDLMTPIAAAQRMCRLLPDSRLVVLPGSSHYAPVEQPAIINAAVDRLLGRAHQAARNFSDKPWR